MKKTYLIIAAVVTIAIAVFIGFLLGRKHAFQPDPKPIIKYLPGDTVEIAIPYPEPYEVVKPIDSLRVIEDAIAKGKYKPQHIVDTLYIPTSADTMAIVQDWATKRLYTADLGADTLGKVHVNIIVQYNQLDSLEASFMPIIKEVTVTQYKEKTFQPFVGGGLSYPLGGYINGGVIIKGHWGVEGSIGATINKDVQGRLGVIYSF